ncbi:MAG: spinster family MFS transporter, partial [Hyphomonadaceae bacterium]
SDLAGAALAKPADPVVYGNGRTGWMLLLLAAIYANNFCDRSILGILAQPIKVELDITDTQLGLLTGLAFAAFYALFGYPIAHLAGRVGRVNVITVCALFWSGMTALCGTAASYVQLTLFRFGVGVGESGLAAPAHSLISDYVSPAKRTTAISLFFIGVPVGSLIGSIAGGYIAQNYGWREAFLIVSIPGFILAPLLKFTVKEPPRGNWDAGRLAGVAPAKTPPLWEVVRKQFSTATYRHACVAMVMCNFASSGNAFYGAYFVRRFGLDYTTVGLILGLTGGVASIIGTLVGGYLNDWLARRSKRWCILLPTIALFAALPLYVLSYLQADWRAQVAIFCVATILLGFNAPPFYALTQNLLPGRMRASGAAVAMFFINLIGLGMGPVCFGLVIDFATTHLFQGQGLGDYFAVCGKGTIHLADAAVAKTCHDVLAAGTRWTLAGGVLIYLWAGVHYYLASRTVAADLAEAERTN